MKLKNEYILNILSEANKYIDYPFNIDDFNKIIKEYSLLTYNSPKEYAFELGKKINGWNDYISEITQVFQNLYLMSETEKLQIQATKSIENSEKVSSGDRYANSTNELTYSRIKRGTLKAIFSFFNEKQNILEKAFYQCKLVYTKNDDTLLEPKDLVDFPNMNVYLDVLLKEVNKYQQNLVFPMEEYNRVINHYRNVDFNDNKGYVFDVAKKINLFNNCLIDIANYVLILQEEKDSQRKQMLAYKSIEKNDKVSSGDRYANTTPEVVQLRNETNSLKSFYDLLKSKYVFLEKAFYQCKNIYSIEDYSTQKE